MKIKIRTGIFEVQNFNLATENQKVFMRNAENQIVFSLQELEKVEIIARAVMPAKIKFYMTNAITIEGFLLNITDINALIADLKKENIKLILNED